MTDENHEQKQTVLVVDLPPGGADLDQPLQWWVMPVEHAAPAADVRDQQVAFGILRVGGIQLVDRPGAGAHLALRVFVPFDRAHEAAAIAL